MSQSDDFVQKGQKAIDDFLADLVAELDISPTNREEKLKQLTEDYRRDPGILVEIFLRRYFMTPGIPKGGNNDLSLVSELRALQVELESKETNDNEE